MPVVHQGTKGGLTCLAQNRNRRLVSVLDAIRRTRGRFRFDPDGDPGPPVELEGQRVLLVYLFPNLGDVLLLAPVVNALLGGGAKRVGLVLRKNPARVFKLIDLPAKVHALPDALALPAEAAGHADAWADPELADTAEAFAETLANRYDVAVDLTARSDIESRRWVQAAGAAHRFGWIMDGERAEDAGLTWATIDVRHQTERHWSRYQMLPLRCLGISEPDFDLPWQNKTSADDKAMELFGPGDGPRVLIVPGAKAAQKRWDAERFSEVGGRLMQQLEARIVVTGAPDERPLIRSLVVGIGGHASAYTGKDLGTLLALVQQADVVITNDTAPMHLAFLARRPTVAIFTWMSAVCWGPPVTDPRFVVVNAPADASTTAQTTLAHWVHQQVLRLLSDG